LAIKRLSLNTASWAQIKAYAGVLYFEDGNLNHAFEAYKKMNETGAM